MPARSQSAFLGIDLGTSSTKVAAFDLQGGLLALRRCETPTWRGADGWAEHDPEALWQATLTLMKEVREALPEQTIVEAIACTSVGEAGVPLDGAGVPLRPAIAWFDTRSGDEAAFWEQRIGIADVNRITGQPIDPHYGVNKLLWMRAHEPAAFAATRKWLSLADFILLRLSGVYATDRSLASRTMLFDQRRLAWSSDLLAVAGLDASLLPEVHVAGTRVGSLLPEVAAATGLRAGTPVAPAGHDRPCGAYAARGGGGMAIDSTGSAEAIVMPVKTYVERSAEEAGFVSCYADVVPNQYVYSARVGYAGALVDWLRRELGTGIADDQAIASEALEAMIPRPLRPSGLLVYPSFGRTLAPAWNSATRSGAILGLTLAHGRPQIYQALIEGICFSLRNRLDWLEVLSGQPIAAIRVEGGVVRSNLWLELKADITGRAIEAVLIDEPTALGAALLAGVSVGAYSSHDAAARASSPDIRVFEPDLIRKAEFDRTYKDGFLKLPKMIAAFDKALS